MRIHPNEERAHSEHENITLMLLVRSPRAAARPKLRQAGSARSKLPKLAGRIKAVRRNPDP
jgi:hypothetical protein